MEKFKCIAGTCGFLTVLTVELFELEHGIKTFCVQNVRNTE